MTTPYGLFNAENRGILFIGANVEVNEGMIAGERRRDGDLEVNFCKLKRLTNMRFSVSDVAVCLTTTPLTNSSLDRAIESTYSRREITQAR